MATEDELIVELLDRGLDDLLQLSEVLWVVRCHIGVSTNEQAAPLCLYIVRRMLEESLILVGDAIRQTDPHDHVAFVSWGLSPDVATARIASEMAGLQYRVGLGDVCWFCNTERGREMAQPVKSRP